MFIAVQGENRYVFCDEENIINAGSDFTLYLLHFGCTVLEADVLPINQCGNNYVFLFELPCLDSDLYHIQVFQDETLIIQDKIFYQ